MMSKPTDRTLPQPSAFKDVISQAHHLRLALLSSLAEQHLLLAETTVPLICDATALLVNLPASQAQEPVNANDQEIAALRHLAHKFNEVLDAYQQILTSAGQSRAK